MHVSKNKKSNHVRNKELEWTADHGIKQRIFVINNDHSRWRSHLHSYTPTQVLNRNIRAKLSYAQTKLYDIADA